ncbi:MAG: MerR family transcriptional regulator [Pseudomonadota bacterium]
MTGLLRIGDLARLGGVTIKTLRFYDEQGLLRPARVDPQTGYRFYTVEQAEALAQITNLRAAEFSIQEIAELLGAEPTRAAFVAAMAAKKRELRAAQTALDEKISLADMLCALAAEAGPARLRVAPVPDQYVYADRKTVASLGQPVTEMFEAAEAEVASAGARADAAPFLIFHDPPSRKTNLSVEVCIPIETDLADHPRARHLAGGGFAVASVYQGGYEKTDALYDEMTQWINRAGLSQRQPMREIYHRFGADQDDYRLPQKMLARGPTDYLTEIFMPISLSHPQQEMH